jgi:Domain of unknown function (DU1801)
MAVKSETKTRETTASVAGYVAVIADPVKRADSDTLIEMMGRLTGEKPKMWGPSIIGFGQYHYIYDSGREGDSALVGFSPRKAAISIYLVGTYAEESGKTRDALLARLGRYTLAKGCLYVKKLADVDHAVLEQLIALSISERRLHYPK